MRLFFTDWKLTDGTGEVEQLTTNTMDEHQDSVSPDGWWVAYHAHTASNATDMWVLPLEGNR